MNDKTIKNLESLHNKILKSELCKEITEDEMKAFVELKDIAKKENDNYIKGIKDFTKWFFDNKYKDISKKEKCFLVGKDGIWVDAEEIFFDMLKTTSE